MSNSRRAVLCCAMLLLLMCTQASNLGQNLAVLRGHEGPVSLITFHPFLPLALLSASADNSLRLWDASDSHFAPLVLRPGQQTERAGNPHPAAAAAAADPAAAGADQEGAAAAGEPSAMEAAAAAAAAGNAGRGLGAHAGTWEQVASFAEVGLVILVNPAIAELICAVRRSCLQQWKLPDGRTQLRVPQQTFGPDLSMCPTVPCNPAG
jgi:hypothetical protein